MLEIQKVLKYMLENASWLKTNKQTDTARPVHSHHTTEGFMTSFLPNPRDPQIARESGL